MATIFPNNPSVNDTFVSGGKTWKWDGISWGLLPLTTDDIEEGTTLYFTSQRAVDATTPIIASASAAAVSTANSYADSAVSTLDLTSTIVTASTAAVNYLVDSAPGALNTLNELAAALNDDANFSTTVTNSLATKLDSSTAASTYLSQSSASSTYLTQSSASSTYLTQAAGALPSQTGNNNKILTTNGSTLSWSFESNVGSTEQARILGTIGTVDPTFNPSDYRYGINNQAWRMVRQSDGKIIIIGQSFTRAGTQTVGRIARLNADGTWDTQFNSNVSTGADSQILAVAVQPDGKIIVGGQFSSFNGVSRSRLARLNSDGTLDISAGNLSLNSDVSSIAVRSSDGKIFVGGQFTSISGQSYNRLAAINSDWTLDTTYNTNLGTGYNDNVTHLNVLSDGKLVVGGQFTTQNGVTANRISMRNTDGTVDSTFATNVGTAWNAKVTAQFVTNSDQIYTAANTTNFGGATTSRLVRLSSNGTRDATFAPTFDNTISDIETSSDESIIILVGQFLTVNGNSANVSGVAKLASSGGASDTNFLGNLLYFAGNSHQCVVRTSDNGFITSGTFNQAQTLSMAVEHLAYFREDGTLSTTYGDIQPIGGVNHSNDATVNTFALAVDTFGRIHVGGDFNQFNGLGRQTQNYAVLDPNGNVDEFFTKRASRYAAGGRVRAIDIDTAGRAIIGGDFTSFSGGLNYNRIQRFNIDGSPDSTFKSNVGTGANGSVYSICATRDGGALVAGQFTTWGGTAVSGFVKLNSSGVRDTTFQTNIGTASGSNLVYQIKELIDANNGNTVGAIAVGTFTTWNGTTVNRVVKFNASGTRDTTFTTNTGTAANLTIRTVAIDDTNEWSNLAPVYLGGEFTTWNNVSTNRIVKLSSAGAVDTTFQTNIGTGFNGQVNNIIPLRNNRILVVGDFTSFNNININRMAILNTNGTLDRSFVPPTYNDSSSIQSSVLQRNNTVIIGRSRSAYNRSYVPKRGVSRISLGQ